MQKNIGNTKIWQTLKLQRWFGTKYTKMIIIGLMPLFIRGNVVSKPPGNVVNKPVSVFFDNVGINALEFFRTLFPRSWGPISINIFTPQFKHIW